MAPRGISAYLQGIAALVCVPWFTFILVTLALALAPPAIAWRAFAWSFTLLFFGLAVLMLSVHYHSGNKMYKDLGLLVVLAACLATWAGSAIYDHAALQYWLNRGRVPVFNVTASNYSAVVMDASALHFDNYARVDTRRVLGYRNARTGSVHTYCVAPVLDIVAARARKAKFWAVGEDCCEPTWGFACGAAFDRNARSGVVLRNAPTSHSASFNYQRFLEAVRQASEMYQISIVDEPVFVQWALNASSNLADGLHISAILVAVLSVFYMMFSIFMAGCIHWKAGNEERSRSLSLPIMQRYQKMMAK